MSRDRASAAGGFPAVATPVAPGPASMIGARVGQLVVTHQLGEGGMGAVYAAEHEVLRTRRAIKVLLPEWTQNAMIVQRFVNEARAAASIHHRNIIAIHDCGQLTGGSWYIVMDHLEGCTLARFRTSQGGPLSIHLALELLASIANGLEAAHAASIVHRDLKPDNIFLVRHGTNDRHPIILDFGIAKLGERDAAVVTRTGMSAGTPAYMAPEQIRDMKIVDRRSDVYALGLIAYEMITGGWLPYQPPSERASYGQLSAAEIYYRQMSQAPTDPRQHVASIPERWAAAVLGAIHPDPSRRPETPRAFALALAEATPGQGALPSGMELVRGYAPELLESGSLREPVHPSELEGMVPASGHRIPSDAAGTPIGPAVSVAKSYGMRLERDKSRSRRRRLLVVLSSGVAAGGGLALAIGLGAGPLREPPVPRTSSAGAASEPAPRMVRPSLKPESSVTAPAKPETSVPAPAKPEPSAATPAKLESSVPAPARANASVPARAKPAPASGTRLQPSAPLVLAKPSPDPAGLGAAPLQVDAAATGEALASEWRAVQAAISALQKSRGPGAVDPLFARWRRINILSAMTTVESRTAAARELAEIRKGLAAL